MIGLLGAGGMGEVYRAKDTKLNRDVAVKVLSDLVLSDPDRLARFQREAQVLASLNHPNIGQIYGVEDRARVARARRGPTLEEVIYAVFAAPHAVRCTMRCESPARSRSRSKLHTSGASSIAT